MKIIFVCFIIFFSVKAFSQTEDYYCVSYLDSDKSETEISGISILSIDSNIVTFQKNIRKER